MAKSSTKTAKKKVEPTPENKESGEEVVVMGERINKDDNCVNNGAIIWGVLLVFAGLMLLYTSLGGLPWSAWGEVWKFWPVLVVLAGTHIIVGNTWWGRIVLLPLSIVLIGSAFLAAVQLSAPDKAENWPEALQRYVERINEEVSR